MDKQRNELIGYDKIKRRINNKLIELNVMCRISDVIEGRVDAQEYVNKDVQPKEWISRLLWCHYYKLKNIAEGQEHLNDAPLLEIGEAWNDEEEEDEQVIPKGQVKNDKKNKKENKK